MYDYPRTIQGMESHIATQARTIDNLKLLVERLERALDTRLDSEHVALAMSFTGCSEDRCPKPAQEAIVALILHAQALTSQRDTTVSLAGQALGLLAACESAQAMCIAPEHFDIASMLTTAIEKAKNEVQP